MNCDAMKSSILGYLESQTEVFPVRNLCVMSLPLKTLDGRWIEVFIENTGTTQELVHDGGKTISYLEGSGMLLSEGKLVVLADMAKRLGVSLDEGVFKALARQGNTQEAVMSIAQCCSVAMYELLKHKPSVEDVQVRVMAEERVRDWGERHKLRVKNDVRMNGAAHQYRLDFLIESQRPIAISVLTPSYSAMVSADRFALQSLDLKATEYGSWHKLAILGNPDKWKKRSRGVVQKFADDTAEIGSRGLLDDQRTIPDALDRLLTAA